MAINATIQVRRGLLKDFDPTKMLPGEWAVSVDTSTSNQIVWMCFAPGVCKRMGTYEDFQNMVYNATGQIIERYEDAFGSILEKVNTNAEAVSANTDIVLVAKSDIINTYLPQIKSYVSNASASASEAKTYSENAKASASEADKSAEDAKKYSQNAFSTTPDGYEALVDDVDVLKNSIIQTTDRTLYGSKAGGIKLIGIKGASEQGENPSPDYPQEIESVGYSGSLEIKAEGKNQLPPREGVTSNGITYSVDANGVVTANGATTNADSYEFAYFSNKTALPDWLETGVEYIASCNSSASKLLLQCYYYKEDGSAIGVVDTSTSTSFTIPETAVGLILRLYVDRNVTLTNAKAYPMLRKADIEDDTYEPYRSKSITIPLNEPLRGIGDIRDEVVCKDGVCGVLRRIVNIGSYSGETITTDYMSTTGQLSNGASVNYVSTTPTFEPFTDQTPFYGLESFDTVTYISTDSEIEPSIEVKYARTEGDAVTLLNYNQTNLNRIAIAELTSAVLALNQE